MRESIITTDSCMNPKDTRWMIPCIIVDGNNKEYYDMKKIARDKISIIQNVEVFDRALSGERFHTAAPNIYDFQVVMGNYINSGFDIIHLSTSSGISSGSVNGSMIASEFLNSEYGNNRVRILDSLTAGSGGCVLNDYANDLVKQNLTSEEIYEQLKDIRLNIVSTYYISKVSGFVSSGRAPKAIKISDKLSLRYRIDVNKNGYLMPTSIYRGNIDSQFMKYVKSLINEDNIENYNPNYISILITKLNEINIDRAIDYIESFNYFKTDLNVMPFYSAICSYGVEDQVGIGLIKKK